MKPEHITTSTKREALIFAQQYGEEYVQPDNTEAHRAGVGFKDLFEDVMLRNAEDINQYQYDERRSARLFLSRKIDDNHAYSIALGSTNGTDYQISIQELEGRFGGLAHRYHLDEDGLVRRYDYEPLSEKSKAIDRMTKQAMATLGISSDPGEKAAFMLTQLPNKRETDKLARDMGLNDQLVDTNEVNNIRELLEGAEAKRL